MHHDGRSCGGGGGATTSADKGKYGTSMTSCVQSCVCVYVSADVCVCSYMCIFVNMYVESW